MSDNFVVFGPCCACGQVLPLTTILLLDKLAPTPEQGWGCVQCDLPMNGAIALVCEQCVGNLADVRYACAGYPTNPARVPLERLSGEHKHDLSRHPEITPGPVCCICGCTEDHACIDGNGQPCRWVTPDLCSACAVLLKETTGKCLTALAGGIQ